MMTNGDHEGQIFLSHPHTNKGFFFLLTLQGRHRVFKSGPAVETIEGRRHERGGEHERGIVPLSLWGVWGSPPRFFFLILSASL